MFEILCLSEYSFVLFEEPASGPSLHPTSFLELLHPAQHAAGSKGGSTSLAVSRHAVASLGLSPLVTAYCQTVLFIWLKRSRKGV